MFTIKQSNKQKVANYILSYVPFSLLKGMFKITPLIGYYHLVSDKDVLHIKHLYTYKNVQQFKDDLDFILRNFSPLSLPDFLGYLKTGQVLPDNAFLLTFDDGLREAHDIITPILLAKGLPATFFVSSAFVDNKNLAHDHKASLIVGRLRASKIPSLERRIKDILQGNGQQVSDVENCILSINYHQCEVLNEIADAIGLDYQEYLTESAPYLTTDQMEQMIRRGFTIGAHGIDHPLYSTLSLDQQLKQTEVSMKFVRERFALNYGAFAFPHNDNGVSKDFFTEVQKNGLVDISFGTSGILDDTRKYHFQRFSLEKPNLPAEKLLEFQIARRVYRTFTGRKQIDR